MIYFVQRGEWGPIKVGYSDDALKRVVALQTGCPEQLVLLATVEGGPEVEKQLHSILAKHRVNADGGTEWFQPSPVIYNMINGALSDYGYDMRRCEFCGLFCPHIANTLIPVYHRCKEADDDCKRNYVAVVVWSAIRSPSTDNWDSAGCRIGMSGRSLLALSKRLGLSVFDGATECASGAIESGVECQAEPAVRPA